MWFFPISCNYLLKHNSEAPYNNNVFLRSSKPHKPDEKWPLYSRSSPHYYTYTADGTSGPAGPRGPRASACAFWNDFLNKLNGVKGIYLPWFLIAWIVDHRYCPYVVLLLVVPPLWVGEIFEFWFPVEIVVQSSCEESFKLQEEFLLFNSL